MMWFISEAATTALCVLVSSFDFFKRVAAARSLVAVFDVVVLVQVLPEANLTGLLEMRPMSAVYFTPCSQGKRPDHILSQ
jgi:hypothetical protein